MIRQLPLLRAITAGLLSLACALTHAAHSPESSDWPSRPVTLVVPFPPGGGNDAVARQIAGPAGQALGQLLVVENRPGAGGTIGSATVARAHPDGYTLLLCSTSSLVVATALYPSLPYRVEDLAPVVHIADTPTVWVADPGVSATNLQEFIAAAKQAPGKYGYASGGTNTMPHLAGRTISARNGLNMLHVPYRGSTPAYADLATGRVNLMMDSIISALPFIESGRVKGLGVSADQRLPQMPSVPTLAEQGLDDLGFVGWVGICAPRDTPHEITAKVARSVQQALAQPSLRETFARQIAKPVGNGPDAFAQKIQRDTVAWRQIIAASQTGQD
ncbi:tripartite tricarboxylate transporter substrate binding protein [Achromobacter aegrifaciens]|uniref:Bug family tripartite tricarboxylate transporter substrate binding protein n=1 Tax=Achromobacter aegrifaciens TaxID=1287736 RepID=UPI0027BA346B|nr:tripartite tricarboxylate transporter substrate binding protein [Achromobacter aegrifaciens]WLW62251.1 tripartite tricarboxylate transporter substrate binding protein [Achromobacter aegrifaciens]